MSSHRCGILWNRLLAFVGICWDILGLLNPLVSGNAQGEPSCITRNNGTGHTRASATYVDRQDGVTGPPASHRHLNTAHSGTPRWVLGENAWFSSQLSVMQNQACHAGLTVPTMMQTCLENCLLHNYGSEGGYVLAIFCLFLPIRLILILFIIIILSILPIRHLFWEDLSRAKKRPEKQYNTTQNEEKSRKPLEKWLIIRSDVEFLGKEPKNMVKKSIFWEKPAKNRDKWEKIKKLQGNQ